MKLLTVTIPSYNSEDYMENAVKSLLGSRDDVEIIIVDDGSTDRTGAIGDALEEEYPDVIRCIHQENGGHGEAVNTGIRYATGQYFKVLDSDDWFDPDALKQVIRTLKSFEADELDMMIVNYIYDKPSENSQHVIKYTNCMPVGRLFRWYDMKHFLPSQNI